ncbi:MAG: CYTH domain-containing protein [Kaistella sp.]
MAIEIERKFLVDHAKWEALSKPQGTLYRQGYISTDPEKTIRVRLAGKKAHLTIKGLSWGIARKEFEYEIPEADAKELLENFTTSEISKTRYEIEFVKKIWEVDVFHGENEGLIVAEIELENEHEKFELPPWVAKEVTSEEKYYNSHLSSRPFKKWKD